MPDESVGLPLIDVQRQMNEANTPAERQAAAEQMAALFEWQMDRPEVHQLMKDLRALIDSYDGDRVLVGETDDVSYLGNGCDELHLVFNFPLMHHSQLDAGRVRQNQAERLASLPAGSWPCNTQGNHDTTRVYSRLSDGRHGDEIARLALMLMLTLKGTPFLYYGEEIGMTDLLLDDISQFRDLWGVWNYHALQEQQGLPADEALRQAAHFSRDRCRTPMQWSSAANGGFCPAGTAPWLPVNPNHRAGINVAQQSDEPHSLLNFYRALLQLRRATPALVSGEYRLLPPEDQELLAFTRHSSGQRCLVALNLSDKTTCLAPNSELPASGTVLFSTTPRRKKDDISLPALPIEPFEGLIVALGQE